MDQRKVLQRVRLGSEAPGGPARVVVDGWNGLDRAWIVTVLRSPSRKTAVQG